MTYDFNGRLRLISEVHIPVAIFTTFKTYGY